jgi:hypothetical protein
MLVKQGSNFTKWLEISLNMLDNIIYTHYNSININTAFSMEVLKMAVKKVFPVDVVKTSDPAVFLASSQTDPNHYYRLRVNLKTLLVEHCPCVAWSQFHNDCMHACAVDDLNREQRYDLYRARHAAPAPAKVIRLDSKRPAAVPASIENKGTLNGNRPFSLKRA